MYHGTNRGSQGIAFFEDGRPKDDIDTAQSVNFTVDGVSKLTSYASIILSSDIYMK